MDEFDAQLTDSFREQEPDYNMAPSKTAPMLVARADDAEGFERLLTSAQWGLVPSWAKDPSIGSRMINARTESVHTKPSFRSAFARRRAVIPADGYYEWYGPKEAGRRSPRQPFYMSHADGSSIAMAGLYEFWRSGPGDPWLVTFTIMTTTATDELGHIHERMPMMLSEGALDDWLDPRIDNPDQLFDLLTPTVNSVTKLATWPVSTAVNNVRNNGPDLIKPVDLE